MNRATVSIVRYQKPLESVKKAVEMSGAFEGLPKDGKVFIKPNIVFWNRKTDFPKCGLITTSRTVEDIVILLKEYGVKDISIGEGCGSVIKAKDGQIPAHAFESLGYNLLKKRYGIKVLNIFERPFKKVEVEPGIELSFNVDFIESDFIVDIPVMKTHAQTVVSLGAKNLKGIIDMASRKKCHSPDPKKDLHYMISLIPPVIPPSMTLIDGIYSNERGPLFGEIRRSNLLVASKDMLSADMVGAKILGHHTQNVPHLAHQARRLGRPLDLSDIKIKGEAVEDVASYHEYALPSSSDGELPSEMAEMGVKGLTCRTPGSTICTFCVGLLGLTTVAIATAWKGKECESVEILSGKTMKPTPGKKKTILFGKCMYDLNKDDPNIQEMFAIKGCPPTPENVVKVLHQVGIMVEPAMIEQPEILLKGFMILANQRPDFDQSLYTVK